MFLFLLKFLTTIWILNLDFDPLIQWSRFLLYWNIKQAFLISYFPIFSTLLSSLFFTFGILFQYYYLCNTVCRFTKISYYSIEHLHTIYIVKLSHPASMPFCLLFSPNAFMVSFVIFSFRICPFLHANGLFSFCFHA